ncbi:hypothetical protein P7L53_17850 [Thermoleptolyngbya sichuanensis XZ-Cy5]|uniref:hypothetical protein n=1 Tax=Thermoleptolyngbya sichuanensis TaxID=2885951 RepID=UPI00240D0934|nr:hypothetical protein [Thermoleptolyngbya sichuanensis]MDG2618108.1 hypothetical protein [Thermoleptolyngbya sichuanensis XZ-Cy5]
MLWQQSFQAVGEVGEERRDRPWQGPKQRQDVTWVGFLEIIVLCLAQVSRLLTIIQDGKTLIDPAFHGQQDAKDGLFVSEYLQIEMVNHKPILSIEKS